MRSWKFEKSTRPGLPLLMISISAATARCVLPDAAAAHEQQALPFRRVRPEVDELLHAPLGVLQHGRLLAERVQRAMLVALRNARAGQPLLPPQIALTPARLDAQLVARQRNPSGAVAAGTEWRVDGAGAAWDEFTRMQTRSRMARSHEFCTSAILPSALLRTTSPTLYTVPAKPDEDPSSRISPQRPDAATFLLPNDLERTLRELFRAPESCCRSRTRSFPADETQPPILGFPVAEAPVMKELEHEARPLADRGDGLPGQPRRRRRRRPRRPFSTYVTQLMKVAENALISNLLTDYHAVFWLAHSFDLARHFANIPRRISALDAQAGRALGDTLKYRIFGRWVSETREQMTQLVGARRAAARRRGTARHCSSSGSCRTTSSSSPRSSSGPICASCATSSPATCGATSRASATPSSGCAPRPPSCCRKNAPSAPRCRCSASIPTAASRWRCCSTRASRPSSSIIPAAQNAVTREEREQFQLIARRVREFAVLNQLRRGITWMTTLPDGQIVSADSPQRAHGLLALHAADGFRPLRRASIRWCTASG